MNNIQKLGKNCCGCTACGQVCPKHCIRFEPDGEGFVYPQVDESECVSCGKCVRHCPIMSSPDGNLPLDVYGVKYKDEKRLANSTSGGAFVPLALDVINAGGAVFGCAYDENLRAEHVCVQTPDELKRLQGSKYVQSDISGIYGKVYDELKVGRRVLFSGTPCQAAGLRTFLGREYDNLLTVDIVCHGVPSPKLFEKYIGFLGKKSGGAVQSYDFRSKKPRGWGLFYRYRTENAEKHGSGFDDPYYSAFLMCKTYRESCYNCPFARGERQGDVTLADFWGIEYINPSFYSKKGVSLVLVNTEKGRKALNAASGSVECMDESLENAVKMNKNLVHPSPRPACRDDIYSGMDGDFEKYVAEKLAVKPDIKRKIKSLVPVGVKGRIKYFLGKF